MLFKRRGAPAPVGDPLRDLHGGDSLQGPAAVPDERAPEGREEHPHSQPHQPAVGAEARRRRRRVVRAPLPHRRAPAEQALPHSVPAPHHD